MTLQEKAELLDMYQILKSAVMAACHFKISESNIRTTGEKVEISWNCRYSYSSRKENLALFRKIPFSHTENEAFMWVQDYYMNGIPTHSKMTWEKGKSLYDKLKQKQSEGSKAREYNASKGWFDHFRKVWFKNVLNKRSSFCQPRGSRWIPGHLKNHWGESISAWRGF